MARGIIKTTELCKSKTDIYEYMVCDQDQQSSFFVDMFNISLLKLGLMYPIDTPNK